MQPLHGSAPDVVRTLGGGVQEGGLGNAGSFGKAVMASASSNSNANGNSYGGHIQTHGGRGEPAGSTGTDHAPGDSDGMRQRSNGPSHKFLTHGTGGPGTPQHHHDGPSPVISSGATVGPSGLWYGSGGQMQSVELARPPVAAGLGHHAGDTPGGTFPVADAVSTEPGAGNTGNGGGTAGQGKVVGGAKKFEAPWFMAPRVLLVDDDAVCRMLSARLLQLFGCTFDLASDGSEALEFINLGRKYDIILMDIVMPHVDGVTATTQIRQFDTTTPIISMTSNTTEHDCITYITSGMTDILPKPFNRDALLKVIQTYCPHLLKTPMTSASPSHHSTGRTSSESFHSTAPLGSEPAARHIMNASENGVHVEPGEEHSLGTMTGAINGRGQHPVTPGAGGPPGLSRAAQLSSLSSPMVGQGAGASNGPVRDTLMMNGEMLFNLLGRPV
ncbi:hypothetical protein HDU93_006580 [Gonapodya sp. JEL0774]|nr:hypothetical protein HDU93_006580 [Gonapodya sp. JEL0774]